MCRSYTKIPGLFLGQYFLKHMTLLALLRPVICDKITCDRNNRLNAKNYKYTTHTDEQRSRLFLFNEINQKICEQLRLIMTLCSDSLKWSGIQLGRKKSSGLNSLRNRFVFECWLLQKVYLIDEDRQDIQNAKVEVDAVIRNE